MRKRGRPNGLVAFRVNSSPSISLLRALGLRWVVQRMWFATERKAGLLKRRAPVESWASVPPFAPETEAFAESWRHSAPRLPVASQRIHWAATAAPNRRSQSFELLKSELRLLKQGSFSFFSGRRHELGWPPRWNYNPLSAVEVPSQFHWSELSDFNYGDIKGVWEASRFSWGFTLVEGWLSSSDPAFPELFWTLVEDWAKSNPPNQGANWKCGQETAIRLFGLAFGLHAFATAPVTTNARIGLAAKIAFASAKRIQSHIAYALSQRNNHGISEAAGLITAGALWPSLPGAQCWLSDGLRFLESQVTELVYSDGAFSQQSTNYHRLLLQNLLWCEAVLTAAGSRLPERVQAQAGKAARFLWNLMEPNGRIHRYGADDGANLLPLSSCSYDDFRPTVAAALRIFCNESFDSGEWDEMGQLLFGLPASSRTAARWDGIQHFPEGGIFMARQGSISSLFRAPTRFRHRPSHADHLHVDLWVKGEPITSDPGTYSYNAPGPLGGGMSGARFHNTVTVADADPMEKVSRFLWLPWTPCRLWPEHEGIVQAWHDGYKRLASKFRHGRAWLVQSGSLIVVDRLTGRRDEELVLRWHGLSRSALQSLSIQCSLPSTETWITKDDDTGEGWFSERYLEKTASWCRRVAARGRFAHFVTAWGIETKLGNCRLQAGGQSFRLPVDEDEPVMMRDR